ncbi:hypothetical protein LAZ67_15000684 [Cordylochernes scorpioides]|uniref:Uncharacterized protein n=1 Tax=Cordylochernes scorpioides TaxID=51811 RepID=A0ABY6LCC5_9ARAC|nr:hypothetical protein LAZ67_15000684 [Cordylochernes scorpioides]
MRFGLLALISVVQAVPQRPDKTGPSGILKNHETDCSYPVCQTNGKDGLCLAKRGRLLEPILRRLRESIRKKRLEKWISGEWMFHHDNAPAHRALSVGAFFD